MDKPIESLVASRRAALAKLSHPPSFDADSSTWGLALSGGGIRSATFCYGLLRALAKSGLLLRFDLLSTISGGGYIGGMLGRLFHRAGEQQPSLVDDIVSRLGDGNTAWFSEWLRANGRYLTPSGVGDKLYAAAVFIRNLCAVHLELGVIGLFAGVLLSASDLLAWWLLARAADHWAGLEALSLWRDWVVWVPSLWIAMMVLIPLMVVRGLQYQAVALEPATRRSVAAVGLLVAILLFAIRSYLVGSPESYGRDAREVLLAFGIGLGLAWSVAAALSKGAPNHEDAEQIRHALTQKLVLLFRMFCGLLLAGLIDRCAWWLAYEHVSWQDVGIGLAALAAAARVVLPKLASAARAGGSGALLALASLLGRLLTFVVLVWWVAVVHRTSLSAIFDPEGPRFLETLPSLLAMGLACVLYMLLTGFNLDFLNLFSLHSFYRSRLTRSYLGAANPARFPNHAFPTAPAVPLSDLQADLLPDVGVVAPDDDIGFSSYRPHRGGGPVHLITVCANETRRRGLFNQDRKGRPLVVTSGTGFGARAGPEIVKLGGKDWCPLSGSKSSLSLGSWMAISGAAISTAMGGRTRGGLPALAMFAGARLGYWWDSSCLAPTPVRVPLWRSLFAKSLQLCRETLGQFSLDANERWYLSDGGHFENTGAYALIAQRCKVVVVADCGADPEYRFEDIENLVRKARIDLKCDIRFQRPKASYAGLEDYGSLNDLASDQSQCCLALARLDYLDPAEHGYLLVVKPNMCSGLSIDLSNFNRQQPSFPQQSTSDQFFDEAQWESYSQLGAALGSKLFKNLPDVLALAPEFFMDDDGVSVGVTSRPATAVASSMATAGGETNRPRSAAVTAVTASLGAGVVFAAGAAAWQVYSASQTSSAQRIEREQSSLKELTDLWSKLPPEAVDFTRFRTSGDAQARPLSPTAAQAAGDLAGALSRLSATICPDADWFNRNPLAVEIVAHGVVACRALDTKSSPPSCRWLESSVKPDADPSKATCLRQGITLLEEQRDADRCAQYWAFDYSTHASGRCAFPGFSRFQQKIEKGVKLEYATGEFLRPPPVNYWQSIFTGWPFPASTKEPCRGYLVRPVIFSEARRADADVMRRDWNALGAAVEPVTNAVLKARTLEEAYPIIVRSGEIRFSGESAQSCVDGLNSRPDAKSQNYKSYKETQRAPQTPADLGVIDVVIASTDPAQAAQEHYKAIAEAEDKGSLAAAPEKSAVDSKTPTADVNAQEAKADAPPPVSSAGSDARPRSK